MAKRASTILTITPPSSEHNSFSTVLVPVNLLLILVNLLTMRLDKPHISVPADKNKVKTDKKLLKKSSKG